MRAREESKSTSRGECDYLADFLTMTFDAVVVFDPRDRIIFWNPAAERMFGWDSSEVIGKTSAELFWPLSAVEEHEALAENRLQMHRGETIQGEHQPRRKDGSSFWVEYRLCASFDKQGRHSGYMAVYRNITGMKRAQEDIRHLHTELHARLDEFSTLLDVLPTGVWIGNEDCSVITGNRAAYEILGLKPGINASVTHPEPEMPDGLQIFVNGEEVRPEEAPMQQVARSGRPLSNLEHGFLFPDGTWKTIHASIIPVLDENGQVKKVIGAYTDFTERKKLEDEIRQISKMPEENPYPVMRLTPEGKVLYANPAANSLLESWKQADHGLPETLRRQVAEAVALRVKRVAEVEHEGRTFLCTLTPITEAGYVNLYAIDDTEQKLAVQRLRESEERLAATYDLAPIGIVECSPSCQYINVNEEFCRITGYTRSELLRMTFRELTHEDDYFYDAALHARLLAGRIPYYRLEKRYIRKDGSTLWVEVTRSLVRSPLGEALYSVGAVVDITERKRADQALAESARVQATLYQLADRLQRTNSTEGIYNAALDAILDSLHCDRASILLFDEQDIMRFVAWRGLSDAYRAATDGHSPWRPDAKNPEPIAISDIAAADLEDSLRAVIEKEGIRALAFIPLVSSGRVIGKFMVYYSQPHTFHEGEVDLSLTIAHQLAFGIERTRAEAKLRESEERYRTIVDTANEGIWYVGLEAETMYLNEQMARLLGYSVDEVIGRKVPEFCFEEDASQAQARIASNYQGNYEHFDFRFRCKDGDEVFVLASTSPVRDAQGKVIGALGMFGDITDRKRAEEALRAKEEALRIENERFMRFVNSNIVGILIGDSSGGVIMANDYYLRLLGVSRQEFIEGKVDWKKFTPAEWLPADEKAIQELREHGICQPYEKEYIRADGTRVPVYIADAMLPGDEIAAFVVDISERKQAEEALRQSEERFARFMQYLPGLAWIKDVQGRYIFVNASAEKAFNRSWDQLNGKTDAEIFPPEVTEQFRKNDEQALAQGQGIQVIETLEQDDGVLHYSLVSKFPIPGPDGSTALIGGTAFDVTDRILTENALREHERQLKELNETLEQKVKERTEEVRRLASDLTRAEQRERDRIAHILHDDLQQRLYAIQMQMTFLHGGLPLGPELQKELTEIKEQLDDAVILTRSLSIDLSPPILHDEGLTQAIGWLASQMQELHGLHIELRSDGSFAIPDSELQVLLFNCVRELLFNIVKHAGVDEARVSLQRHNNNLEIQIYDRGNGFVVNESELVDMEQAAEEGRRSTSFGLPTIRRQLSLFGGRMDVWSAPGAGTQVTLTLPAFEKDEGTSR